jgi:NAD(P)-dependent dehydrogenase (short-subunit alcohol dehydrogenase family)
MKYLESLFSLENKVAIVTGGARGNGKAIATALFNAGAEVLICDVLEKEMKQTVDDLKTIESSRMNGFLCDLSNTSEIDGLINKIMSMCRIDVLVNNAGITIGNDTLNYSMEDWKKTLNINLSVPFVLSKAVGEVMKNQKFGSIINITSLNSEQGFSGNPAYVASKGGLKQLSKALAMDLGKYGVRVNNIAPGYVITNMTSKSYGNNESRQARTDRTILGRWGKPEDLSGLVVLLASDASSYITGQDFYVDGGWLAKGI